MITLPKHLTATKYPGYFWDVTQFELYSIKIGGKLRLLRPKSFSFMKKFSPWVYQLDCDSFLYQVSHKGKRKYMTDKYLYSLKLEDSEIPYGNS